MTNYETVKTHIDMIRPGDTVLHNGELRTVSNSDIKRDGSMGATLFGDSYRLGAMPVQLARITTQKPMCIGDLCCGERGNLPAVRMMPQSADQGVTVDMVAVCDNHAWGWWDAADWDGRHLETAI